MSDDQINWGDKPIYRSPAPNVTAIRLHIEWLIKPVIGTEYEDALFEIAYQRPDEGGMIARLFEVGQVDEAIKFVVEKNLAGFNVYIGATLKEPDADRYSRTDISDFYIATAVPADVDKHYNAAMARMAATIGHSELTVVTGTKPDIRSHHWFRLSVLCTDNHEFAQLFESLVYGIGADKNVKDPARLMRLGGTVAYPSKAKRDRGYNIELTTVILKDGVPPLREAQIRALEPIAFEGEAGKAVAITRDHTDGEIVKDGFGKVIDGREQWFRNLVYAMIIQFQEQNGCDPRPEDIAPEAFKLFAMRCDLSDGRWTQCKLMRRINNTFRRFDTGRLNIKPIGQPRPAEAPPFQWGDRLIAKADGPKITKETNPNADEDYQIPQIKTLHQLINEYTPREYVVDGVIRKGFLYTPTGKSGHLKTMAFIRVGVEVALGNPIGEFDTEQCTVAFLAGENPEIVRDRLAVLCEAEGYETDDLPFYIYEDTFKLDVGYKKVIADAERLGGFGLVIVDTFSAYCRENDIDENDNPRMGKWTKDVLRNLTKLPGNPAVLAISHPALAVQSKAELKPRGASATMGEVDGIITVWRENNIVEISAHPEKFRGAPFTLQMQMKVGKVSYLKDKKGRPIEDIYGSVITQNDVDRMEDETERFDLSVLRAMEKYRGDFDEWPSARQLSKAMANVAPERISARQRVMASEKGLRLVAKTKRAKTSPYKLTKAGEEYLRDAANEKDNRFEIDVP